MSEQKELLRCDLTQNDVKEVVEMLRWDYFGEMTDEQFCEVIETNYYPLPFYSIGHLGKLCEKAGLRAKILITNG